MNRFFIAVTISFAILKEETYGQLTITTPENFFVPSKPLAINCTSAVPVLNGVIQYRVNDAVVVTIRYLDSTKQCLYVLPNTTITSNCNTICGCDLNGRSALYIYSYGGENANLTLECIASTNNDKLSAGLVVEKAYGPASIKLFPSQNIYIINETDLLGPITCSADCLPNCTFQWTGPETSRSSGKLEISDITKSKNGTFTCTASSQFGQEVTVGINVIVQYGPQDTALEPSNKTYTIERGKTLGPIYCTASCNPVCTMVWTGPGIKAMSNNLTFTNISRNKTGIFTCISSNIVSRQEKVIDVTVHFGPESMTINPIHDIIKVNETDSLGPINCTADCLPHCTFQWTGPTMTSNNRFLLIASTVKSQNGTYSCTATNMYGEASVKVDVIVQYGPTDITFSPTNQTFTLKESETLKINCLANCYPECEYFWRGSLMERQTGNLTVDNITRYQSGNFSCEAVNVAGSFTKTVGIIVYYAANVTSMTIHNLSDQLGYVKENDTLDFLCYADGLPTPHIKWFYTKITGHTEEMISANANHTIQQASCTQMGYYTCEASNGIFPNVNRTKFVNITCPPTIIEECSTRQMTVVKRNQTQFIAACLQSNPEPNIKWTKLDGNDSYNATIMTSHTVTNNTLIYTSVVETILLNEEEIYLFMTAYNTFGNLTPVPFHVEIADKPFEPRKVSVQCEEKNTIQWYPNSNGGSEQHFGIEFIENNQTKRWTSVNIVDEGTQTRHLYIFTNLKPSTYYMFYVVATNELGSKSSTGVSCLTAGRLTSVGNSPAIIAGGTVAGCVSLVVFITVTVFIKRRHSQASSGKDKGFIKGDTNNDSNDDEDGLKDNPMYVSNDTLGIHSSVKKTEGRGKQATGKSSNTKYADTVKTEKKGCVFESIVNIPEGHEYGNVDGKSANSYSAYIPKKNKDGLLYAELELNSASGGFVIRGLENKNIYADIDITKRAEPLPFDNDNDETSEQKGD